MSYISQEVMSDLEESKYQNAELRDFHVRKVNG